MGGVPAHEADKVPVLDSGCRVGEHVSNQLRVDFAGRVKANAGADVLVVNVAVDTAGHDNDAGLAIVVNEELGQVNAVSEGVSSTDHHETSETKFLANLSSLNFFGFRAELVLASTDVVNASQVLVVLEVFILKSVVVLREEALNTVDESDDADVFALGLVAE